MIGPCGWPEDLLSVSGIQTSVGRHFQLAHLGFHPLGHNWFWFPLSPKCETEKCYFEDLLLSVFTMLRQALLVLSSKNVHTPKRTVRSLFHCSQTA